MDKWTTLCSAAASLRVAHLPTAPATTAAVEWFPFQSSNGSLFSRQRAGWVAKLVPFSLDKNTPLGETKNLAEPIAEPRHCMNRRHWVGPRRRLRDGANAARPGNDRRPAQDRRYPAPARLRRGRRQEGHARQLGALPAAGVGLSFPLDGDYILAQRLSPKRSSQRLMPANCVGT